MNDHGLAWPRYTALQQRRHGRGSPDGFGFGFVGIAGGLAVLMAAASLFVR
jgi:hypothetical protein